MSSLFIIGNGFDLAHNMPTKYSDLRNHIIKTYPESQKCRDRVVYLEDCAEIYIDDIAAEMLLYVMDHACDNDWNNFEDALAHINFYKKFPRRIHKENETQEEDNMGAEAFLLYIDNLSTVFIKSTACWQAFFRVWINEIKQALESGKYQPKESLKTLFSEPDSQFFTFNYTKTLQKLYGIKKVIHIHNRVGQKLIFGHGEKNIFYSEPMVDGSIGSSFLDDMLMSFQKDTVSPFKKYNDFFKRLNTDIDRVYTFGFSYSRVDSVYIKEIIKNISKNATWYFTKHDTLDSKTLGVKKTKLRRYGFQGEFNVFDA